MLRKFLLTLILSLGLSAAWATTPAYCELFFETDHGGKTVDVGILWGTKVPEKTKVVKLDGKKIKFESVLEALDYMGPMGWKIVGSYYTDKGEDYHIILCKDVNSADEVFEGFKLVAK